MCDIKSLESDSTSVSSVMGELVVANRRGSLLWWTFVTWTGIFKEGGGRMEQFQ